VGGNGLTQPALPQVCKNLGLADRVSPNAGGKDDQSNEGETQAENPPPVLWLGY